MRGIKTPFCNSQSLRVFWRPVILAAPSKIDIRRTRFMRKQTAALAAAALLLLSCGANWAAAAGHSKKKSADAADDDSGIDKKRFEDYLKARMAKIKAAQDARS